MTATVPKRPSPNYSEPLCALGKRAKSVPSPPFLKSKAQGKNAVLDMSQTYLTVCVHLLRLLGQTAEFDLAKL